MKYRGYAVEPEDPKVSVYTKILGHAGFHVIGPNLDGHAGTIEDAKEMVDDRIANRGGFAPQPRKPSSKSPNIVDTSGRYFESDDAWRFHWTTTKDSDGNFRAIAIRPTGSGSQAGAKVIRKRELAGERISWKVVKRAKRRMRSDAKALADKWCTQHQKACEERNFIKDRKKEERVQSSLLRRAFVPEGVLCGALTEEALCAKPSGKKQGYVGEKRIALCPQHSANVTMDRKVFAVVDGEKRRVTREPRVGVIELDEEVVGPMPKSPRLRKFRSR